jgi:hypothetical protein
MSPFMAQSRRTESQPRCPLLGALQTSHALRAHRGIHDRRDNSDSIATADGRSARLSRRRITSNVSGFQEMFRIVSIASHDPQGRPWCASIPSRIE